VSAREGAISFAVVAVALLLAAPCAAEDKAVLDAPAPPTLPALAHPSLTYTFELTIADILPTGRASAGNRAFALFSHNELEVPLKSRKWYVGAAHDLVAGAVPGVGSSRFLGNPELWARGLWSSVVGLSSGGGFGLVLPIPRDISETEAKVLSTARVVRPWDSAYFSDLTLTLRPWFDIRHVTGRFIFQFRQGLDVSFLLRKPKEGEALHIPDFTARATLYVGYRATRAVGLGLELWEVYQVTADIDDDKRASFAISPSVRLLLGRVAPALSVLLPITTPLRGEASTYYAARLNVGFDFDFGRSRRAKNAAARWQEP